MYNIHDYLAERKKGIIMTLDSILSSIKGNKSNVLLPAAHKSVSLIKDEPFYVGTNFNQIHSNLNPRFILVSAPGATGKSAFGKHVAYLRKAIYWNLAEINIGDGTFQGTLYKALGVSKISEYAQDLQNGNVTLVIDAFDEAEIISGRKNVETFLFEANEFLEGATTASVVLLSRTETAQNIAVFFKNNEIPYIHYEIGYFPETKAREFVLQSAAHRRSITPAVEECVNQYFNQVQALVHDKEIAERFLGYAPVLEAIAAHITEISNTARLLSALRERANETSLIQKIMDNLLEREQQKFTAAFRVRIAGHEDKVSDWDAIYSKDEQLVRILNYILFGKNNFADYPVNSIPPIFIDEYIQTIDLFLPQHPFIQNTFKDRSDSSKIDFAGPAFRDYCLAYLILNEKFEASAELYYQSEASDAHFPSQLFWNHYIDLNDGRIKSKHFSYLTEAYKSKTSIGCQTYLDLNQDEEGTIATFRIESEKETIDCISLDVEVDNNTFIFGNLSNTSIQIDGTVVLGQNDNIHITDSTIFCNELVIDAKSLHIASYAPCITTICSKQDVSNRRATPLNIVITATNEIQVDIPNIFEFPKLSRFKKSLITEDSLDIYSFVHGLRRIFSSFRTHKKDMPARDAEKIDFVIVAGSPLKQDILEFLKQKQIIFKSAHLYKVNITQMSSSGIDWGALIATDIDQLRPVYDQFCSWKADRP